MADDQKLMHGDLATFEALLDRLMSSNNDERSAAQETLERLQQSADLAAQHLVQALRRSTNEQSRNMAAVLLRRFLIKDSSNAWEKLSTDVKNVVKSELMLVLQEETNSNILRVVADLVGELGALLAENNQWPELLPFVFTCSQSGQDRMVIAALRVFTELSQCVIQALVPHLPAIEGVLSSCLGSQSQDVAVAALTATCSFITCLGTPQERDRFQAAVPTMIQILGNTLNAGNELAAQDAMEQLIEVAEEEPRFLRRQLPHTVTAMITIAEAPTLDEATRKLAAEFLVTLCEAREKAPGMMRKLPDFLLRLFRCLMTFLLDVDDDPDWYRADTEDALNAGEGELFDSGQDYLDRLSISVGGGTIAPIVAQVLPEFLRGADWQQRHAALICLAQVAEGCAKVMTGQVSQVVAMIIEAAHDSHQRVRWALCQTLGQLCTDLGPDIQEKEHGRILPALLHLMSDASSPRVQAHATAALVNFSEQSEQEVIGPYLDTLISKLIELLQQSGQRLVQEGALTALASVADAAQAHFVKYYDHVMPLLSNVLVSVANKEQRMLRAKALECASLVGMAVGKEKFGRDANAIIDVMKRLQEGGTNPTGAADDDDDPIASYMQQAWTRICKCLGADFIPYMSWVMPPLIRSASITPDVQVLEDDEEAAEDVEDVDTIHVGDKRIVIHTATLEEKATACNMLYCYVDELGAGFAPWAEEVVQVMAPLCSFYFHDEVRKAAVMSVPELLDSAKQGVAQGQLPGKDTAWVKGMLDFIWSKLQAAVVKEPETDILSDMLQADCRIIEVAGELLSQEQLAGLIDDLARVMARSEERRQKRIERQKHEDFDAEEAEALEEEIELEEDVLDSVQEVLSGLLRRFKAAVLPLVARLIPGFAPMLDKGRTASERRIAVCVFDDVIEFASEGGAALQYVDDLLPVYLECCSSKDSALRQCAVYGLGLVAQHATTKFVPACGQVLQTVVAMVQAPNARDDEHENATDNAVSCLGKMIEHCPEVFDSRAAAGVLLDYLPVKGDRAEAKEVHEQLCRLVETSSAAILGENNANLPRVINIMARVLTHGTALVRQEGAQRMATLLQQMHQMMPAEVFAQASQGLDATQQANLQAACQGQLANLQVVKLS
ncbi:unnamed protein product [Pedinophyceae sp. YPF-701]|nr:unnamed protein product [Pedinophyceae sp. YPF-701]